MGIDNLVQSVQRGDVLGGVFDGVGIVVDAAALIVPVVPGGAGAGIKGLRALTKTDEVIDSVRATETVVDSITDGSRIVENMSGLPIGSTIRSAMTDWHHAFPKFLGGIQDQVRFFVPRGLHQQFHRGLYQALQTATGMQFRGLSARAIANLFKNDSELQAKALNTLVNFTRGFDNTNGTGILHALWESIVRGDFN